MCKSQAQGGQRCASHARTALAAAEKAMNAAVQAHVNAMLTNAPRTEQDAAAEAARAAAARHDQAEIEYASTPTGRRDYEEKVKAFYANPYRHEPSGRRIVAGWNAIIAKGDALRRENTAARTSERPPPPEPMTTDEFDVRYQPVRGTADHQRRPLVTTDPSDWGPEESRHWWTVQYGHNDDTITYIAGVSGTRSEFLRTTHPWNTGHETVAVDDNRHLDYDPSQYAAR